MVPKEGQERGLEKHRCQSFWLLQLTTGPEPHFPCGGDQPSLPRPSLTAAPWGLVGTWRQNQNQGPSSAVVNPPWRRWKTLAEIQLCYWLLWDLPEGPICHTTKCVRLARIDWKIWPPWKLQSLDLAAQSSAKDVLAPVSFQSTNNKGRGSLGPRSISHEVSCPIDLRRPPKLGHPAHLGTGRHKLNRGWGAPVIFS